MANGVFILGGTGSGKSASLRNMSDQNTFLINVADKPLPFGKKISSAVFSEKNKNYFVTNDSLKIRELMDDIDQNGTHVNNLIIDDVQYIMADEFMDRVGEKGYDKWNELADNIYRILRKIRYLTRKDLNIFLLSHDDFEDIDNNKKRRKAKTLGRLLDDKITLEGMITIVLFTHIEKKASDKFAKYYFQTQTVGNDTCKSPMGMFDEMYIDNDLNYVSNKIFEYYGITPNKK